MKFELNDIDIEVAPPNEHCVDVESREKWVLISSPESIKMGRKVPLIDGWTNPDQAVLFGQPDNYKTSL